MKKLVEFIAKNIVSQPQEIKVEEHLENEGQTIIKLSVAPQDMGKIIGRSGKIIKAIRDLLKIKAIKEGQRVYLELSEQKPK